MNSFLSFFRIRGVLLSILSEYICILFQVSLVYSYLLLGELGFGYETMSSWGSITFFVPALTDIARDYRLIAATSTSGQRLTGYCLVSSR
jgi:hypothetical protein